MLLNSVSLGALASQGVTPPAFDYVISQQSDWAAIPSDLAENGGVIGVEPGAYSDITLEMRPSAELKFVGKDGRPRIDRLTLIGCENLTFEHGECVSTEWSSSARPAVAWMQRSGGAPANGNIKFSDWSRRGNYRGDPDFDFDPAAEYPEYASIIPEFDSNGAVVGLEIANNYVGDLVDDGTHSLTFQSIGGSFSVAPVATFTVSGGYITATNLVSGGASTFTNATTRGARSRIVTWDGQNRMVDYMPRGDSVVAGTGFVSVPVVTGPLEITDSEYTLCGDAFKSATGSFFRFQRNWSDMVYMDHLYTTCSAVDGEFIITDNLMSRTLAKSGDPGDPHMDGIIQLSMVSSASGFDPATISPLKNQICGNIYTSGGARGYSQGIFLADPQPGLGYGGFIACNYVLTHSYNNALVLENSDSAHVWGNVVTHSNPTTETPSIST